MGVEKSDRPQASTHRLETVLTALALAPSMPSRLDGMPGYGPYLEQKGTPIGANDYWIAAQGAALDAVVVTDNEREFCRVPGLKVENWLRGPG